LARRPAGERDPSAAAARARAGRIARAAGRADAEALSRAVTRIRFCASLSGRLLPIIRRLPPSSVSVACALGAKATTIPDSSAIPRIFLSTIFSLTRRIARSPQPTRRIADGGRG
jgi:pilus assembly protein TadC